MKINACIELPEGVIGPDPWDSEGGYELPLDQIICRDEFGNPHYVRDQIWPWTAYHPLKKRTLLHFLYWKHSREPVQIKQSEISPTREALIREIQLLLFKQIYSKSGVLLSCGTLKEKLKSLYLIARFAEARTCSVRDVFGHQVLLDDFLSSVPGSFVRLWVTNLKYFSGLAAERELAFDFATPRRWGEFLQRGRAWHSDLHQYAPLPTRIYAELINNLSNELDDFEEHADNLISTLREAIFLSPSRTSGKGIGGDIINRHGLSQWFMQRSYSISLKGLTRAVDEIFGICKLEIHVFSGMRHAEVLSLPFDCTVTELADHGRKHCLIAGTTTKLSGGGKSKRTIWVTTENEGFRAIRLAQRFASIIHEHRSTTPDWADDVRILFPSPSYLPWTPATNRMRQDRMAHAQLLTSALDASLFEKLCPVIEESDVAELEQIDPFRSWREESKFAVGKHWPLTTHQLRRTLALYANASGLVHLSSLRRQLQHITREMTMYYGRGSTFCKNFVAEDPVGFKKHIASEWQSSAEEAKMLAFTLDVLNCAEPMFGGAGNFFRRQCERGQIMSAEDVRKQFKAGLLNYNEGPLGGCTKPGLCSARKGLLLIDIACATENCKYLIGKHSKIIQVLDLKRASMMHMNPESISYAMEYEELKALEQIEVAWRTKSEDSVVAPGGTND